MGELRKKLFCLEAMHKRRPASIISTGNGLQINHMGHED